MGVAPDALAAENDAAPANYVKDSRDVWTGERDAMPGQEVACKAVFTVRGGETYTARGRLSPGLEYVEVVSVLENGVPVNASYCTVVTRWLGDGSAFALHFSPLFAPAGEVRLEIGYTVRVTGQADRTAAVELIDSRGETLSGAAAHIRSFSLTVSRGTALSDGDRGNDPLSGAGFCLYRDRAGQKRVAFTVGADGGYIACTGYGCGHNSHVYLLSTPENGTLELQGLAQGTFYLREERTPPGHTPAADMLEITVSGEGELCAGGALLTDGRLSLLEQSAAVTVRTEKNGFIAFFETGSKLLAAVLAVMLSFRRYLFC